MTRDRRDRRDRREWGGIAGSVLLLAALAAAGAAWWWFAGGDEVTVIDQDRVVTVQRKDLLKAVIATGRVEPNARVAVMSRASGILKELFVDEGDAVAKGQIIAELDREQLVALHNENLGNLAAAEARLKAAKARLEEAKVRLRDPELSFARSQAERSQRLFEDGTLSQTELDDPMFRLATVEYRIRQVEANIPVLEAGVAQAEADLDSAKAALERTETALREATIYSPIDGVVLLRDKEVGDGISSILTAGGNATPIMTLGDLSSMFVEARVDEVDVGRIYAGMRAVITVDAFRDRQFEGVVERIAPAGTVDNNGIVTFLVKIAVIDPERRLRVDMTANTRLVEEERPAALTLPHRTIGRDGRAWFVDKVISDEPPEVERVNVTIGVSDGLMTELVEGVAEGDRILMPDQASSSPRR